MEYRSILSGGSANALFEMLTLITGASSSLPHHITLMQTVIGGRMIKGGLDTIPYNEVYVRAGGVGRISLDRDVTATETTANDDNNDDTNNDQPPPPPTTIKRSFRPTHSPLHPLRRLRPSRRPPPRPCPLRHRIWPYRRQRPTPPLPHARTWHPRLHGEIAARYATDHG